MKKTGEIKEAKITQKSPSLFELAERSSKWALKYRPKISSVKKEQK